MDEGKDGRHKYGYMTDEPDHDITFVVSKHHCATDALQSQDCCPWDHLCLLRLWSQQHCMVQLSAAQALN